MKTKTNQLNNLLNNNIENIISQRLNLQSTQKNLSSFGLKIQTIKDIKDNKPYIRTIYSNWPEDKQKSFIVTLGGGANFKQTKAYIEK